MKLVLALICGLLVLLGAESASAGPGKGVKTFLVPAPVVEVKPHRVGGGMHHNFADCRNGKQIGEAGNDDVLTGS